MQPRLTEYESCGVTLLGDTTCPGGVTFAFTGRSGGVSEGGFASLNLGANTGDDPACVRENRRRALAALLSVGGDGPERAEELLESLLCPLQVHGAKVALVRTGEDAELERIRREISEGCDAIVCCAPDIPVLLCYADCVPVVLVCEGGFAVIHSGWKGTFARIAEAALSVLTKECGVPPSQVSAYIGPHIAGADYEVSPELAERFAAEFGVRVIVGERNLDLARAIRITLEGAGMGSDSIAECAISTPRSTDGYYSYRAQDGHCGRHGAIAIRRA